MIAVKGGTDAPINRLRRSDRQEAARRRQESRLNNFLDRDQRSAAVAMSWRRMWWYHGEGVTQPTGRRLSAVIAALPTEAQRAAAELAFLPAAGRVALRGLLRAPHAVMDHGTVHLYATDWTGERTQLIASLELEPAEMFDEAERVNNPTGLLAGAPPGALRILCVCSAGLQTGVALRLRAETLLRRWRVDAWLEVRAAYAADPRFADIVLATEDERPEVEAWSHPVSVIVGNDLSGREIAARLSDVIPLPNRKDRT